MAEFSTSEVCSSTEGQIIKSDGNVLFSGICTDTRSVKAGDLFIALQGDQFDGHDFAAQALLNGAAGVVVQRSDLCGLGEGTVFLVKDTRKALQNLAAFHRRRFQLPVIAITGSNGKTTTKDLTASVLASRFHVLKTEGNFNNEIGLPLTLLNLTEDHDVAVVEMGMRGLGEIAELAQIGEPTAGIITNVGETHMELLGSLENIATAKSELVSAIPQSGFVLLNDDDPYVKDMKRKALCRVISYGMNPNCHIQASEITLTNHQTRFICRCFDQVFPVILPAVGKHNVYNALAAIGAGWEMGLKAEEITKGLLYFQASSMRQHIEQIREYTLINDAYNASPLSMASALDTLQQVAQGRTVAVLGDMLELGDVAVDAHRRIGRLAAERGIQVVVSVGRLARYISEAAKEAGVQQVIHCENHQQATDELNRILRPGDTVLIKGSRGMKMEQLVKMIG